MTQQPFPYTFGSLTTALMSYLDSNFSVVVRGPAITVNGNVPYWDNPLGTSQNAGYPTLPIVGTITTLVGVDGSNRLPAVDASQLINLPAVTGQIAPVRQTITSGPVDGTTGLPTFLPATSVNLNLTTQNISASVPLGVSSANGISAGSGADVDRFGFTTANLTWTGLTANSTNFLYVTIAAGGALTTGFTTLTPVYQWGGTPATPSGQFTFNIGSMIAYLGNGSSAPQTYVVFLGEAVTSGTAVTSTVAYAYNGKYDSGFTATLPAAATATAKNHNIGVPPRFADFIIECTTGDANWTVGDNFSALRGLTTNDTTPAQRNVPVKLLRNTVTVYPGSNASTYTLGNAAGNGIVLTAANWRWKMIADRGW